MKKLLFFAFISSTCIAMEGQATITPINNGLLTELKATVAKTVCAERDSIGFSCVKKKIIGLEQKHDSLINLMYYNELDFPLSMNGPCTRFHPLIVKESKDGSLENLGTFNKNKHHEVVEALRQNKALYFDLEHGVIIYSLLQQPAPELCTRHKQLIQEYLKTSTTNLRV